MISVFDTLMREFIVRLFLVSTQHVSRSKVRSWSTPHTYMDIQPLVYIRPWRRTNICVAGYACSKDSCGPIP